MKNRIVSILLSLCLTLALLQGTAWATDSGTCGDNLTYSYNDGTLTIQGTGNMDDYFSDYELRDKKLPPWHAYHTQIHTVIIGDGVTSIGRDAFEGCSSLTSVTIPESVTSIGVYAFDDCRSLTSVTIPNSVTTIEHSAFRNCTRLTSVTIPDSVTRIGSDTFENCIRLTSVTIPNSVTSIGVGAFEGCSDLTSLMIPCSVTTIEFGAFRYCDSLKDVYYNGSDIQWKQIKIDNYNKCNDPLLNAIIHYNSTGPDSGNSGVSDTNNTNDSRSTTHFNNPKIMDLPKVNNYDQPFLDVSDSSWYAEAVKNAFEYGMMVGISDTLFNPDGNITVAEAVAIACRLHSYYNETEITSSEQNPTSWYEPYVAYALKYKIIKDTYDYDNYATRGEFITIMSGAVPDELLEEINDIDAGDIPDLITDSPFDNAIHALAYAEVLDYTDSFAVLGMAMASNMHWGSGETPYSTNAVYRLYRAGVIVGNDEYGSFMPFSNISRASVAAIISRIVDPLLRQHVTLVVRPVNPVPMSELDNLVSIRSNASNAELEQAYEKARKIVEPLAGLDREAQLFGIATAMRAITEKQISYSTSAAHYNDPYGFFILQSASCAGNTRATGLCLNMLGISYEHVGENQRNHQWCRVKVGEKYWICDAYGLYCGPEMSPYEHPYAS